MLVQRNAGRIRLRGICARKHTQGTAPRPAHAPRDPPRNGQAGRAKQQRCCAQRRKFPYSGKNRSSAVRAARIRRADLAFPFEGKVPEGRMRCSAPARLCRQMLHFASLTEILSLRYRLSVFLSRRKKNSEKERPLRGLRREMRSLCRRRKGRPHNELNAAPPPETPPGNGQAGSGN